MTTAVFDTNVYLQAAISPTGPAFACWKLVLDGVVRVFALPETIAEIRDVIRRPELAEKFPSIRGLRGTQTLRNYRNKSHLVYQVKSLDFKVRDADDQKFLDLAVAAKADFLVTRDRDLLDLRHDSEFNSKFEPLKIVDPVEFLQIVRKT